MFSNIPMRSITNVLMGEKRNGGLGGVDQYKKGLGALGKELGLFKNRGGSLHGLVVKSPPMKTHFQKELAAPPEKAVDKPHKASEWVKKAAKPRKYKKKAVEEAEAQPKLDNHKTNPIAKEARKGGAISDATAAIVGSQEGAHHASGDADAKAGHEGGHVDAGHAKAVADAQVGHESEHVHTEAQTHADESQKEHEVTKKEKERLRAEVQELRQALGGAHALVGKRAQEHEAQTRELHAKHKEASEASRRAYGELSASYEAHRQEMAKRAGEQEARHAEAIRGLKQAHVDALHRKHQEHQSQLEELHAKHLTVKERVAELEAAKASKGGGGWSLFGGGSKVSPMMYDQQTSTSPQKPGKSVSTSPLKEAGQQVVEGSNQSMGGGGSAAAAAAAAKQELKHEGQVDDEPKAKKIAEALLAEGRVLKAGYRITAGGYYQKGPKRSSKELATEVVAKV